MKPKLFIGSSSKGIDVANAIHQGLRHDAEVTIWNQGLFKLSKTIYDQLLSKAFETDFAVLVFTPDDATKINNKDLVTARDNVIFELGLFLGKLGQERTFFLLPEHNDQLRIPTDLEGVVYGTYEDKRSDNNLIAGVGPFCNEVRTCLREYTQSSFHQNHVQKYDAHFVSIVEKSTKFEGSAAFYDEFNHHLRGTTESIIQVGSGFHCADSSGKNLAESYLRVLSGCALRHKYVRIELAEPTMTYWGKLIIDHLAPMRNVEILIPSKSSRSSFLLKDICLMDPGTDRAIVELMLPTQKISPTADSEIEVAGEGIFIKSRKISDSFCRLIYKLRQQKVIVPATINELKEYFSFRENEDNTDDEVYYFAYGSNMLNEQMSDRVSGSMPIGPAKLPGYKICFNIPGTIFKNTVCNIICDESSVVWGVLYCVKRKEFIKRMDFYEGVTHGEYYRQEVNVILQNGENVSTFVYLSEKLAKESMPSSTYLDIMLRGANQNMLPKEYIQMLEGWKLEAT